MSAVVDVDLIRVPLPEKAATHNDKFSVQGLLSPKAEVRRPKEARRSKAEIRIRERALPKLAHGGGLPFLHSRLGFHSEFGLRISAFGFPFTGCGANRSRSGLTSRRNPAFFSNQSDRSSFQDLVSRVESLEAVKSSESRPSAETPHSQHDSHKAPRDCGARRRPNRRNPVLFCNQYSATSNQSIQSSGFRVQGSRFSPLTPTLSTLFPLNSQHSTRSALLFPPTP